MEKRMKWLALVGRLRRQGLATDASPRRQGLSRQLKEANRRNARYAVILRPQAVGVKHLATGRQTDVTEAEFIEDPRSCLRQAGS